MKDIFAKYKLESNTIDFLGHAVALYVDDTYLEKPAAPALENMALYLDSIGRYGDSPFLYPIYGLGGLPEAFSRLCAIHGGTYMLNTQVDEILFDESGKVSGIKSGDATATAPLVICDPSYAGDKFVKPIGKVIRAICLLNHPIPHTNNAQSIQIILPAKQLLKNTGKYNHKTHIFHFSALRNDIQWIDIFLNLFFLCHYNADFHLLIQTDTYISMVSYSHLICANGFYVAIVSGTVETDNPE